jgi:hypothetical protein
MVSIGIGRGLSQGYTGIEGEKFLPKRGIFRKSRREYLLEHVEFGRGRLVI